MFQYGWVLTNLLNSVILLPFYVRNIDAATLGIWLATGSILAWMTLVDPGVGEVLQQRIAESCGRGKYQEVGKMIGSGIIASILMLILSIVIGLICVLFAGAIIDKDIGRYPRLAAALVITVVSTGLSLVSFSISGINQGLQNARPTAVASISANFLFLLVNLLLLDRGLGVMSIAIANVLKNLYINSFNLVALRRVLRRNDCQVIYDKGHFRRFVRIFSFTSAGKIVTGLANSIDMIALSRFITPEMITVYEINKRPINMTNTLVARHSVALMPSVSHARGNDDQHAIVRVVETHFRFYYYAAFLTSFLFWCVYPDFITVWTGAGHFAGARITGLLVLSSFVGLMGYFMSNIGYALGDIKINSLFNLVRNFVYGILLYFAARAYGITGTLSVSIGLAVLADLFFFVYRVHRMGCLPVGLIRRTLRKWSVIVPCCLAGGWAIQQLANLLFGPEAQEARVVAIPGLCCLFYLLLLLAVEPDWRKMVQTFIFKTKQPMSRLVVMLRVKDGMFFLAEWLKRYEKLADEIVALDNGSTDGTYETLLAHPRVVSVLRTEGYHEGRDKNMLYAEARKRNPQWCLWVDVDELFEPELTRAHFDRLMRRPFIRKYAFRRFHFIDREHFAGSWFRLNYSSGHDRIMWRESPSGYFQDRILDSPNVKGIGGLKWNTNYRLKHLGYINKELVDKKADIYRAIEPGKESTFQEMYLRGERPMRWSDRRGSLRVVLLNGLLTCLQLKRIPSKVARRIGRMAKFSEPNAELQ